MLLFNLLGLKLMSDTGNCQFAYLAYKVHGICHFLDVSDKTTFLVKYGMPQCPLTNAYLYYWTIEA